MPAASPYQHQDNASPLHSAVIGAVSGATSKTITAPLERIKLVVQLHQKQQQPQSAKPSSIWSVTTDLYHRQGILSFWKGNTPSVLQKAGNQALNFLFLDHYKMQLIVHFQMTQQYSKYHVSWIAAGLSGTTTCAITYPLEFLRTRLALDLQSKGNKYKGMWHVTKEVIATDGIAGCYKGFGPSLIYVTLHRILYLGGFDMAKTAWLDHVATIQTASNNNNDKLQMLHRIILAQFVSLGSAILIYPLDTIRRKLMMQAGESKKQYTTWTGCARYVYAHEGGVSAFFRGMVPRLFQSIGGAIVLISYDTLKGML